MQPIKFDQCNRTLTGPEGSNIADLPALVEDGIVTTVWRLSADEREMVRRGGCVCLQVMSGETQPPVKLMVVSTGVSARQQNLMERPVSKKVPGQNRQRPNAKKDRKRANKAAREAKAALKAREQARRAAVAPVVAEVQS